MEFLHKNKHIGDLYNLENTETKTKLKIALWPGAEEYTNCFSTEG